LCIKKVQWPPGLWTLWRATAGKRMGEGGETRECRPWVSTSFTLIPLSGVVTCSSCCDQDSATIFMSGSLIICLLMFPLLGHRPSLWMITHRECGLGPAVCLTSILLETEVDANECKCSRDQQLNMPFDDWPLRALLNFHVRTPSALTSDCWAIELLFHLYSLVGVKERVRKVGTKLRKFSDCRPMFLKALYVTW
jgi:hypothetical protein